MLGSKGVCTEAYCISKIMTVGIRVFPEWEQKEGTIPDDCNNPGQIKGLNLSIGHGNGEGKMNSRIIYRTKQKDLYMTVLCLPVCFFG